MQREGLDEVFSSGDGADATLEAVKRAGLKDFRFHDLRHTWASWHRQAATSTDELKDSEAGNRE